MQCIPHQENQLLQAQVVEPEPPATLYGTLKQFTSPRLVGSKAVVYTELSDRQIRLVDGGPKAKAAASKTLSEGSLRRAAHKPEEYTEEHEKALGGCKGEWVLNDDGYTSGGERVYDTISGKTCHQCRWAH